jgi:hypothetical protein
MTSTMITKFDKASLKQVRREVEKALAEVNETLGITLEIGHISYEDNTFTARLKGSVSGFDQRSTEWAVHFQRFGMEEDWLGQTLSYNDQSYKIVGLRPRARRQQILVERDGETYQMDSSVIRSKMATTIHEGLTYRPFQPRPPE